MIRLLDTIDSTLSRELIGHLAARLGESETSITKALSGLVPVVLAGLINKASLGGGQAVYELSYSAMQAANGSNHDLTSVLGLLGSGAAPGSPLALSECLLHSLFGASTELLANTVGEYAGLKCESATALLGLLGALLPALLGQQVARQQLTASSTAALLTGMKRRVHAMLPLGLHGLLGLCWLGGINTEPSEQRACSAGEVAAGLLSPARSASPRWFQALATLVASVSLLVFFWNVTQADIDFARKDTAGLPGVEQVIADASALVQ